MPRLAQLVEHLTVVGKTKRLSRHQGVPSSSLGAGTTSLDSDCIVSSGQTRSHVQVAHVYPLCQSSETTASKKTASQVTVTSSSLSDTPGIGEVGGPSTITSISRVNIPFP